MSALKLVVFDCDGTLVDSQHMIVAAMNRAFSAHSLSLLPREKVLSIVGLSLEEAITKLLPEEDGATVSLVKESYRQAFFHLRQDPSLHEPLFPGAKKALDELSMRDDVLLGVATGKSQRGLQNILELHDIQGHFMTLQTADEHPSKPHPSMMQQAMSDAGVTASQTVIFGDTSYDIVMGRDAGAHAVGVSWGYHDRQELMAYGAPHVLDHFDDLVPYLDAHWSGDAAAKRSLEIEGDAS